MADSLNIKNPSVRQGDLDLRTDASGNIVSISGHPIAGGGGGGGTTYYGDNEYIQIKNGTVNTFTVTDKVKDVVDNLTEKIALQVDAQTYNKNDIDTKLSAKQDELVFEGYEDKIETINGSGFIVNGYVSDFAYNIDKNNFNKKIDYLSASVSSKQDKLIFEYDEDNKVSAINGSALAGQGGTTYTPGQYINIDSNNEISVTGVVASDEYATYSGDWNDVSNSYKTNSGSFLTSEALTNYATKTYVDGKDPVLIGDSNITAASSTVDGHTQWNLAVNVTPVVTDTKLVGDNCVTAHTTTNSGEWIVGLEQTAYEAIDSIDDISNDVNTLKNASANWNKVSDKLDTTAFSTVSGNFLTAHQSLDDYATKSDINDMATQTWVGQQGFYTKASGDNDYAPKSVIATINTLTGASAGWNNVTAKLDKSIYSNASGNWEASYNVLTAYSAAGTWLTAHQSLTNYYTKSETSGASELSDEFAKYVTSSNVSTQDANYVMTTTGWKVLTLPGGGMTAVIHDETLTGLGNVDNSKLSVAWSALSGNTINSAKSAGSATSADKAESAVSAKWLREGDAHVSAGDVTALQHWASSNSSTWNEVSAKLGTAQYANDSATFVTSSNSTIIGTKQYALTTAGWAEVQAGTSFTGVVTGIGLSGTGLSNFPLGINTTNMNADRHYSFTTNGWSETDTWLMNRFQFENGVSGVPDMTNYKMRIGLSGNYLPTSGGTVSGQLVVSGDGNFDQENLKFIRSGQNGYGRIGLASNGALAVKVDDSNSNTTQINVAANASYNELIQVQHGGTTAYLIPAQIHTGSYTPTSDDGILHIVLES